MTALRDRLRLVVVTDRRRARGSLVDVVRAAIRGGASAVQLREKDLSARELMELARPLRDVTGEAGALFLVNDRLDVALAAGADGVHLGWRSLAPADARRVAGRSFVVGVSTHGEEEAALAEQAGADFVTFGPVFDTPSKHELLAARGPAGLRRAASATSLPVVALGGIREGLIAELRPAGAAGIAVLSSVMEAPDPESAARGLLEEWTAGPSRAERPRGAAVRPEERP
jgi:thiamine-phosphate pyrophosphorylase